MGRSNRTLRLSRYLSLVLRHDPSVACVTLDEEGWIDVETLLEGAAQQGRPFTRKDLDEVVRTSSKRRFALSEDGLRIRATHGHSVKVNLGLQPEDPPAVLYHGTAEPFVESILASGLNRSSRQYVHLSTSIAAAQEAGRRRGRAVVLAVDAAGMQARGFRFFRSSSGVWLTDDVPSRFLSKVLAVFQSRRKWQV